MRAHWSLRRRPINLWRWKARRKLYDHEKTFKSRELQFGNIHFAGLKINKQNDGSLCSCIRCRIKLGLQFSRKTAHVQITLEEARAVVAEPYQPWCCSHTQYYVWSQWFIIYQAACQGPERMHQASHKDSAARFEIARSWPRFSSCCVCLRRQLREQRRKQNSAVLLCTANWF